MKMSYAVTLFVLETVIFAVTTGSIIGALAGACVMFTIMVWASKAKQHA